MKQVNIIVVLLLVVIVAVGQNGNAKRLNELDEEISIAFQDAYESNKAPVYNSNISISIASNETSLKSGFYLEGITALGIFVGDYASPGCGVSLGYLKYLSNKKKNIQFGLKGQSSLAYYFLDEVFMIDLFQVGPQWAVPFGSNAAFEFGLLGGLTLDSELAYETNACFDLGTFMKIRISNFSVGLDIDHNRIPDMDYTYNYATQDWDYYQVKSSVLRFGIKVGCKF